MGVKIFLKINLSKGFQIYLFLVISSFILFIAIYQFIPPWIKETDINSALYLLSSIVQSEAAVIGIVVTLSIVAVQLTASSYSTRVIGIFRGSSSLWILLSTYIVAIIFSLCVLKFLKPTVDQFSNNELLIWISYLLGIYAFGALIPYILDILDFMRPKTIIKILASNITKKSLLSTMAAEDYNVNYRASGGPLQPLSDIMLNSLMKYDYGTLKDSLKAIESSMSLILVNETLSIAEIDISNHLFLHHILRVGEISLDREDGGSASLIIESLSRFSLMGLKHDVSFFSGQAANAIGEIGNKAALMRNEYVVTSSQVYLNIIGEEAAKKELETVVDTVLFFGMMICRNAVAQYNIDMINDTTTYDQANFTDSVLLTSLTNAERIGEIAISKNNQIMLDYAIANLDDINSTIENVQLDRDYFKERQKMIEESKIKFINARKKLKI